MKDYLPIAIYCDTTNQYTMVEIPVPADLLEQWWREKINRKGTDDDFTYWVFSESDCDMTIGLYDWLCEHNYFWKRLD